MIICFFKLLEFHNNKLKKVEVSSHCEFRLGLFMCRGFLEGKGEGVEELKDTAGREAGRCVVEGKGERVEGLPDATEEDAGCRGKKGSLYMAREDRARQPCSALFGLGWGGGSGSSRA